MWKLVVTFLALIALPSEAHAVTAIVAAVAAIFGGGLIATAIAYVVVSFAISYIVNKAFAPEKEERETPADQGVKQRIATDPRNKLPVVYGTKSVAGQITYAEISNDNQKMAFIISLAEGPVSSINSVKWEDKTLRFSGGLSTSTDNSVNGAAPDTDPTNFGDDFLNGRFKCQVFPNGGPCQPMVNFSSSNNDSKWSSSNRTMPNTAYAFVELTYDQEKRVTSLTNRLQFNITGRTVRELVKTGDVYSFGSEITSENPAEILVDYMTNARYGAGVPVDAMDLKTFYDHKVFCDDTTQSYTKSPVDGGATATGKKRYTTNGVINTNQDVDQNVTDLTVGNSAMLTWNYGQFGLVSDKEKDSVFSFSEDNIFGKIQISKLGFDNKLNEITAKFDSFKSKEQEEQIIIPFTDINDNEPVLERTVTLPMTDNAIEARRVATIYINKSRQDLTVNFSTSIEASGIESGDVISLSHKTPGFENKLFLVHSVEEKVANGIIGLEITAQEYAAGVYTDVPNDEDPAPNTKLPNPFVSPKIENLTSSEDITISEPNVILSWGDVDDSVLVGQYEINYNVQNRLTADVSVGDRIITVQSTAGFPDAGTILLNDGTANNVESFTYESKTAGTFNTNILTGAQTTKAHSSASSNGIVSSALVNFRTVSGGTRYEISPLIAQVTYAAEVTPVSTLGNRGNTLSTSVKTGEARVIGEAGADGTSGLNGIFERAVYFNNNNTPDTPQAGNDYNTISDSVNAPTNVGGDQQWTNDPDASDTIQRWVSRATVNTNGEQREESLIAFDENATSGVQTLISNQTRESGYFDVKGNPGTAVADVRETTIITTNGVTGRVVSYPSKAEEHLISLTGTNMGTSSGSQPATADITTITLSGNANHSSPSGRNHTRFGNNGTSSATSTSPGFSSIEGQAYGDGKLVYVGFDGSNTGYIALSRNGGLAFTQSLNSGQELRAVRYGDSGGVGYFVAVGDSGTIRVSTDGISWADKSQGSNNFTSIAFSGGTWAAVGSGKAIYTSTNPNSVSFTSRGFTPSTDFNKVLPGKSSTGVDIFVAVGTNGEIASQTVANHSSGWDDNSGLSISSEMRGLDFDKEDQQWAASTADGKVYRTNNGNGTWTEGGSTGETEGYDVACGNGQIISAGRNRVVYSTDGGDNFTNAGATAAKFLNRINFVGGIFIIQGSFFGNASDIYAGYEGNDFSAFKLSLTAFPNVQFINDPTYLNDQLTNNDAGFVAYAGGGGGSNFTHTISINGSVTASYTSNEPARFIGSSIAPNNTNSDYIFKNINDGTGSNSIGGVEIFKKDGGTFTVTASSGSGVTATATNNTEVGSCTFLQGSATKQRTESVDACTIRSYNSVFRRANRIAAAGNLFAPRESFYELDFDDNFGGTGKLEGTFSNQSDGDAMAVQLANDIAVAVEESGNNIGFMISKKAVQVSYSDTAVATGTYVINVNGISAASFTITGSISDEELVSELAGVFSFAGYTATSVSGQSVGSKVLITSDNDIPFAITTSNGSGSTSSIQTSVVMITQDTPGAVTTPVSFSTAIDNESSDPQGLWSTTLWNFGDAASVIAKVRAGAALVENKKTAYTITVPSGHGETTISDTFANNATLSAAVTELRAHFGTGLDFNNYTKGDATGTGTRTFTVASHINVAYTGSATSGTYTITVDDTEAASVTISSTLTASELATALKDAFSLTGFTATVSSNNVLVFKTDGTTFDVITSDGVGSVSNDTGSETPSITIVIDEVGTDISSSPITVTAAVSVNQQGEEPVDTGGATTFSMSVNGNVEATDVSFSEDADADTQATEIVSGIGAVSNHTVSRVDNVVTIVAATIAGPRPDTELHYTFLADDGHTVNQVEVATTVSATTVSVTDASQFTATGTVSIGDGTNTQTFTYDARDTTSDPNTLSHTSNEINSVYAIGTSVIQMEITDGVLGKTPDGMIIDFRGASNPSEHEFTFGSNQTPAQVRDIIISEGNTATNVDGVTFYNGDAAASTTTTELITAGDHAFVNVANTIGFPQPTGGGSVSVDIDGTTFLYTSMTSGSDLFGDCTIDPYTERTGCEAAVNSNSVNGVYTPFIRLNGAATTFPEIASGSTVTTTLVRSPGVTSGEARVYWEQDIARSNGEINILTVTGTATDGDVTLTINDGTTTSNVTATVAVANDLNTNTGLIRSAIATQLTTDSSFVTVVTGDVDNRIRLVGSSSAGNYTVALTGTSGLSIDIPSTPQQAFLNSTVVNIGGEVSATGQVGRVRGTANGTFDITESSGVTVVGTTSAVVHNGTDEFIIGELTTAEVTINGVLYTISYRGRETDGNQFTPFELADAQEQADQLVNFLNNQE